MLDRQQPDKERCFLFDSSSGFPFEESFIKLNAFLNRYKQELGEVRPFDIKSDFIINFTALYGSVADQGIKVIRPL